MIEDQDKVFEDDVQTIVIIDSDEENEYLESCYEDLLWLEDGEIGSDEEEVDMFSFTSDSDLVHSSEDEEEDFYNESILTTLESKYDYLNVDDSLEFSILNHGQIFGGQNTHRNHDMKRVKSKYKKQRINPKRRIHHREYKKRLEEENDKMEMRGSKVYVPPTISYANRNNNNTSSAPNLYRHAHFAPPRSEEEEQLQLAMALSVEHHEMSNMARECGMDMSVLLALTTRELTEKDYELLLQLDNGVKKKTVCSSALLSLPTCILSFEEKLVSTTFVEEEMPQVCQGDMCVTCMCDFEEGEELKWIPKCGHIFHKDCIDSWLESQSTVCPICRVDVADS
ncbi:hypothetical protein C9374_011503 [Naegleria lovaniensis]|uniref:RING-type domain-containing protein n=1 Tax=Naegleria lovaniensis TaxID=51637 RepID=A0AA88GXD8_NAELO|nr:uncharacterized protein C9374_011503 [Naegleria lovaniensis]KAG2392778.1 hypothetical protein C9374_011503 [Naegleria lovaniensis]